MPARLTFSNSLEALADRLLDNLENEAGDPLRAPIIATPAPAARDWLKVHLAEKSGIIANVAFPHLENLLWDRLAERDKARTVADRQPAKLLDGFSFQGLVLAQLRAQPPKALQEYLSPAGADPHDIARRLCQLSGRLASLFREYEYNRVAENGFKGVAESWMSGEPCFERHLLRGKSASLNNRNGDERLKEVHALEAWQMEIYQALFRKGDGLRDRWGEASKTYRYTLPQYAQLALEDPKIPDIKGDAPVFHLFGLSNVSPFHRDLIGRLADSDTLKAGAAHFEVYALNPCAEFWEDAYTLRERRARGQRSLQKTIVPADRVIETQPDAEERANGALRDATDENGLLALFGKPGRETVKLWCQLTDHDFLEDFREPTGDSLLSTVRRSVLHRAGVLEARVTQDELRRGESTNLLASLRLRRAPDVRAEIEAARAEAAIVLRQDATLRAEDLAILAADVATALPILRAAFAGGVETPGNAPVLLPDGGEPDENPLLRGLRDLLTLGSGSGGIADRRAVLAFLENPVVLRRAGLEPTRMRAVASFMEAAGFQEGWEDPASNSTLKSACDRALMAYAVDVEDSAFSFSTTDFRPASEAIAGLEREEAAALLEWMETLREMTKPLRENSVRSFSEWTNLLRQLRTRFLAPGPEDARTDVELSRFFEELEAWGGWKDAKAEGNASDVGAADADAVLIRTLFEDRFRGAEGPSRSSFLRGGIRVGSLMALRGLPFRHVWIIGLSAEFPASGEAAPLDLRSYRRLPGESDPATRDLYALLETIATTSDSLSLSWPAHGANGGDRQPSRALTGFMSWLESDVLADGTPLEFEAMNPPAETPLPVSKKHSVEWALESVGKDSADIVRWRDLKTFMENPAFHAATRRFRANVWDALDTDEEDRSAALFLDRREEERLVEPALNAELLEPGTGVQTFDRLWNDLRLSGRTPPAPYADVEEARLRGHLESNVASAITSLQTLMEETGLQFVGSLRLGPQDSERPQYPVLNLPALNGIGGIFPWFFTGRRKEGGWGILVAKGEEFPAYLLQLCGEAADNLPETIRHVFRGPIHIIVRDPKKANGTLEVYSPRPFTFEEAREILDNLLGDYARAATGDGHLDDLPLARIESILKEVDGDPGRVHDWGEALVEARRAYEELIGSRATRRDRLMRAMDAGVSTDTATAVRSRLLPYLQWKKDLYGKNVDRESGEDS